jgi:hypothetical protein
VFRDAHAQYVWHRPDLPAPLSVVLHLHGVRDPAARAQPRQLTADGLPAPADGRRRFAPLTTN